MNAKLPSDDSMTRLFLKTKNVCKRTAELYLLWLLVLAAFPADSALMADKLEIIQWGENMKRKDLAHRPIESGLEICESC